MVNQKRLIYKYIFVISIVFLIFLIVRIYYDYSHQQNMLRDKLITLDTNIEAAFDISKKYLVKNYLMLTNHYMQSPVVYQAFKSDNREKLYNFLKNDYTEFTRIDPNLFVMHFINTKNITVLRMHKPLSFHDDLTKKRPIVAYVNKSLKMQNAFEVGKNGIVYRITSPFIYHNEHIGVLEFGIKLSYFTHILKEQFKVSNAQLVRTDQLGVLIAKKQYPKIKNYSLVSQDSIVNNFIDKIDISKDKQIIKTNGKTYLVCYSNLTNYNNQVVAKILSVEDISNLVEKNKLWFQMVNTSSIIVYILVVFFMYMILNKFSKEIQNHLTLISKLNQKSKYLQNKANTDELTQIYNKRYFNTYLDEFLVEDPRGTLLFFDIDHFKRINDTYGHLVGDHILKNLSELIQHNLRQDDLFARWGGEEFIILLKGSTFEFAYKKAESLRQLVERTEIYKDITITISIGITNIENDDSKQNLLDRVDELLYKAKNNGRNCIAV